MALESRRALTLSGNGFGGVFIGKYFGVVTFDVHLSTSGLDALYFLKYELDGSLTITFMQSFVQGLREWMAMGETEEDWGERKGDELDEYPDASAVINAIV
mmetsp:Transcript_11506/g.20797  ORF Transcript_11506/g.20797 Transcript_11506/m.20797 type:complete len:101 (-) Transcript_11506:115-417(-)